MKNLSENHRQSSRVPNPIRVRRHTAMTAQTFTMGGGETVEKSTPAAPTIERKIGSTTYIVSGQYSPTTTETAAQKMQRIILKEAEKVFKTENND